MKKILLAVLVFVLFYASALAIEVVRQKNAATHIFFPIVDADGDFVTSATGLDSEIDTWSDGANPDGFTDCTNEATEVGATGWYYLSLTASEMNVNYVAVQTKTTSAGAKTQAILIRTIVGDPLNLATATDGKEILTGVDGLPTVNVDEWNDGDVSSYGTGYPQVSVTFIEGLDATDQINAAVDVAFISYDPPTRAEATTDKNAIIAEVDANETKIDAVDDYVDDEVATIKGKTDSLNFQGVAAGVALAVDVTRISTDATAANNAELFFDGTGYAGTNNVIPTVTTVSNEVTADAIKISGDATAADNAELFFDGTGYAGTNNVIPSVTTVTGNVDGSVGSVTGAVGSVTGAVGSVTGNVGGNVTGSVGSVVGAVGSVTAGVSLNAAEAGSLNAIAADVDNVVLYTDGDGLDGIDLDIKTIDDFVDTEVAAIVTYTDGDDADGIDANIAAIKAKTDNLPTDPADDSDIDAQLAALPDSAIISRVLGRKVWGLAEEAGDDSTTYAERTVTATASGLDSATTSRIIGRKVWGLETSGDDSSTQAERLVTATAVVDTESVSRSVWDNDIVTQANRTVTASCAGSGLRTVNFYTLNSADSTGIQGFEISVEDSSSGTFMGRTSTDSNGKSTWSLDDDTYTVSLVSTGWTITTPRYVTITANVDSTFYATIFDPGNPASADMCRIYINDVRDIGAGEQAGCKLKVQIPSRYWPIRVGEAPVYVYTFSRVTDASGYVEMDVYRSASLTAGDGTSTVKYDLLLEDPTGKKIAQRKDTEIPDQANWEVDWTE